MCMTSACSTIGLTALAELFLQDLSLLEWVRQQQRAGRLQREAVPACPYHEPAGVLSFALHNHAAGAFCASMQQGVSYLAILGVHLLVRESDNNDEGAQLHCS